MQDKNKSIPGLLRNDHRGPLLAKYGPWCWSYLASHGPRGLLRNNQFIQIKSQSIPVHPWNSVCYVMITVDCGSPSMVHDQISNFWNEKSSKNLELFSALGNFLIIVHTCRSPKTRDTSSLSTKIFRGKISDFSPTVHFSELQLRNHKFYVKFHLEISLYTSMNLSKVRKIFREKNAFS